jgi:carbonic anhydrase
VLARFLSDEIDRLPSLATWLGHAARTKAIVEEHYSYPTGPDLLAVAAAEHVLVQLENLRTIPTVALRLDRGDLHLHGWLVRDGAVSGYAPQRGTFLPLAQ